MQRNLARGFHKTDFPQKNTVRPLTLSVTTTALFLPQDTHTFSQTIHLQKNAAVGTRLACPQNANHIFRLKGTHMPRKLQEPFSSPRRRTKVLREGEKRAKQCQKRTKFDVPSVFHLPLVYFFLKILYILGHCCSCDFIDRLKDCPKTVFLYFF